jgi:Na+/proline symporter
MVALFGIIVAEMLGVTAIVSPFVGGDKDVSFLVAMVLFFLMVLYTALGGNAGVQRSDQFQLGVAYVGLFTLLAGMMLVISDRATLPPHFGTSAAILTLAITAIFAVKRFRIIDATARAIADDELANDPAMLRLARLYRRLETGLNVLAVASMASCLVAVAIAFARSTTMADAASSTRSPVESLPTIAIVSLALLPIAYQLCDISNWQRLGALRPDLSPDNDEEDRKLVRSILRFSVEAPAVWLVLLAFGGIAALYAGTAGGDGTLAAFVSALLAGDDLIGALACSLLLMAILAIALSTMDAVLSAVLLAFREDILFPDPDPPAADEEVQREIELERNRKTNIYAIMFFFVALLLLKLGSQWLVFGEDVYVALLLAFYSAQLAFLPLIVGGVWRGPGAERLKTGPGGALLTLVSGLAASLLLTCLGLAGYGDELGWWAIPGCLGVSALVYLTSCWWPRRQTTVERA